MGVRDVVFTILAIDEASRTLEKVGLSADASGGKLGKFGELAGLAIGGLALGAGAAALKGVEMATSFQAAMERIHTQAGVPQKDIQGLSDKALKLAGSLGVDPNSVADALYHVESNFASLGKKAPDVMQTMTAAIEDSKISGANLTDVTEALLGVLATGEPDVKNASDAMAKMNAIVGAGDMTMADFTSSIGTGVLPIVKQFGVGLVDVGAALGTFKDAGIPAAEAGTMVRMAVQYMAQPAKTAKAELDKLGLTTKTLANDMKTGGLNKAVTDLHDHLVKAGVSSKDTGAVLLDVFGKKGASGVSVLLDRFDAFKGKYAAIDKGASSFGDAWKQTQQTFSQVWDQFRATIDVFLIRLGTALLPVVTRVMQGILDLGSTGKSALDGVMDSPFITDLTPRLQKMGDELSALWGTLEDAGTELLPVLEKAGDEIKSAVEPAISKIAGTIDADVIPALSDLVKAIEPVISWLVDHLAPVVADVFREIGTTIDAALKIISGIIEVVTGIITGNWGQAWDGVKKIVSGAWEEIKGLVSNGLAVIGSLISGAASALWNAGKALLDGLLGGLEAGLGKVTGFFKHLTDMIPNLKGPKAKDKVLLYEAGTTIIGGLLAGFQAAEPQVADYLRALSDRISTIKVSPALKTNLKQFADGLKTQLDADNTGLKRVDTALKAAQANVSSIEKTRATYADTLSAGMGGDITSILKLDTTSTGGIVDAGQQKTLTEAEKAQTAASTQLAAAMKRVNDLQLVDAASAKTSVSQKLALANAQQALTAAQDKFTTANNALTTAQQAVTSTDPATDLRNQLAKRLTDIQAFNANLEKLKTEGLGDDMIQQMAKAGLDTGGQMAAALAAGTPDTINQINTLNAQITKASGDFGNTWSGDMYKTGLTAAQQVVNGLQSQQNAIDTAVSKLGSRLASGVQAALRTGHVASVTPITAARSASAHQTVINVNMPPGIMMGTPADLARQLEQVIQKAAGAGVKVNLNTKATA